MSTLFTENRNLFHTFSRVAIQEGQGVAAAVNKTGHTVTTNDVWAEISKLPKNTKYFGNANDAYTDLKKVYDANSTEFSKYVKLYENAVLSPVDGSGQDFNKNQAWELLIDGKRVKNFVAPTDVFDDDGKPCNGYTLQLFDKSGTQIPATDGNWAFDYVAGLVIFERGKTPQDMGWASTSSDGVVTPIKITAWSYVGETLDKSIESIKDLIDTVQGEALGIEAGSGIIFDTNDETGNTIINTDISLVKVDTTSGYAASYQLKTSSGVVLGDTINIAKDQFLKGAEITEGAMISGKFTSKAEIEELPEDDQVETKKFIHFTFEINKKDADGKVTSDVNNVYLNIHDLVDVYAGGLAIEVTSDNKINLKRSTNSENFFFANSTGAGVSGIQAAIDLAASGLISGVAAIPTTTAGFEYNTLVFTEDGETAIVDVVNNKVVDISEENVETITATTLSSSLPTVGALTGYVDNKFLSTLSTISGGNGIEVSPFVNNTQTVSIKVDGTAGNLVKVTENGIYVSASEYDLPVADINTLGGIKEGGHIEIDENGIVTVKQVQNSLKFGAKEYNGSEEKEILASDLGALTSVTAGTGIIVSTKSDDSQSISLDIKSDDKYLTLSGNALASKGIDEAIIDYVDPKVNFLSSVLKGYDGVSSVINADIALANAIVQEAENRNNDVSFLSGVLKGYESVSAVINADKALSDRLSDVEGQLGGGTGSGSVTEKIKFLSGVLSGYESVSAVINADLTEKSERQAADSYLSGVLCGYTAEGAVKAADDALSTRILTIENWKGADGLQIVKADSPTPGYAATYKLADSATGIARGAVINIPKDQFLSGAVYNSESKTLDLTFAIKTKNAEGFETDAGHTVSIPASSFVHEYQAGSGLIFNAANTTFDIQIDSNSEEYLYVTENGIGLSGIQEALNGVTTSVENTIAPAIDFLSGVLSAYTEEGAVSGAISALDARLDVLEGAENVSGSVQYAVKTKAQFADYTANGTAASGTIQYAICQNTAAIDKLNGDKDTVGSVDYKIDQYDQTISTLITNINTLKNEII